MNNRRTLKNFIQILKDFVRLLILLALLSIPIYLIIKNPLIILIVFLAFLIAVLRIKFRPGKELFNVEAVIAFFKNMTWLYLSLWIAKVSGSLFRRLETTSLTGLQISLLGVMGILLAIALWQLSSEKRREVFFGSVRKYFGGWVPFLYSFTLLYIAISFFGSVTYLLVKNNSLPWTPVNQEITSSQISSFYLWQFVDAIPLLKVNSTIHWQEPLIYDNGGIGFLLLLFKVVVISPILASFIWYRQFLAKEKKEEPPKGKGQKIVYRIVRPKRRTLHL